MANLAKALLINLDAQSIDAIIAGMKSFGQVIYVGSMCSGSGAGEIALDKLIDRIAAFTKLTTGDELDIKPRCMFMCEIDADKAAHLQRLKLTTHASTG